MITINDRQFSDRLKLDKIFPQCLHYNLCSQPNTAIFYTKQDNTLTNEHKKSHERRSNRS
jgi:hypothetical protein